jgi:hypothetical protein
LLTSLPESWNAFISSIDTTALKDSFKLIARVLQEDSRIKEKEGSSQSTALAAKSGKKSNSKFNPRVTCYGCGKVGHIKADCRSSGKKNNNRNRGSQQSNDNTHANVSGKSEDSDQDYAFFTGNPGADSSSQVLATLSRNSWLGDSACQRHVVLNKEDFIDYVETPGHTVVGIGNSPGLGKGTVKINLMEGGKPTQITLTDAIHCPAAPFNLISLGRMTASKRRINLEGNLMQIITPNGRQIGHGTKIANLYHLDVTVTGITRSHATPNAEPASHTLDEWHRIFGHLNPRSVQLLEKKNMVNGMKITDDTVSQCEPCIKAKQHVTPFPKEAERKFDEIGDMTFTDLWGPAQVKGIDGHLEDKERSRSLGISQAR